MYLSGRKIRGADATSFKLESCGGSEVSGEDINRCYWYDDAVPCDCKPHSVAEFPTTVMQYFKEDSASIKANHAISLESIDSQPVSIFDKHYTFVKSGAHTLLFNCTTDENKTVGGKMIVNLKSSHRYELSKIDGNECAVSLVDLARLLGNTGDPEISILVPNNNEPNKYQWGVDIFTQSTTIAATIVCRQVTRERVQEIKNKMTLALEPGHVYQFEGNFTQQGDGCDVKMTDTGL